mmetsp:Transcript_8512/g.4641  ORF Transcript_8512/g.4641 Transcript_8512/m.4641 type:complete len:555 (+) Transcript_8512:450-2114(+)
MKQKIKNLIISSLAYAHKDGNLPSYSLPEIEIHEPKVEVHGDFSTNIAMKMASICKMSPRKIAEIIVSQIKDDEDLIEKVEIAGPGFINFFININCWHYVLKYIYEEDKMYGSSNLGKGKKVQLEFVSANPTGPLHVGHGRGAVYGDTIARLLAFCGFEVKKEYYINDSGRQIKILGLSVFLRYKELFGEKIDFPKDCYHGKYTVDIAEEIKRKKNKSLLKLAEDEAIDFCAHEAIDILLYSIKSDLKEFGVEFDTWFSEQSLYDSNKVDLVIKDFQKKQFIYEKDGALWFKTTSFGDEKDRVVVRQNSMTTYFASDMAYHQDKYKRGFDRIIDVWGADHHGYIPRIVASIKASGYDEEQFDVILVQLVNLLRAGKPVAMSTRTGEFVTLKDVVNEVGSDAARFLFLTRDHESHLDFDLELAKKKTNDNPVYYVQYVHARIASIAVKAKEGGLASSNWDNNAILLLKEPEEVTLIKSISRFPEVIKLSAELMEPHRLTFYLMNLASEFHSYYNKHRILTNDTLLAKGRMYLADAVKKVIKSGLTLLGVSAPEKM